MGGVDRMRGAWERRTDEELFHAYFLEELTPAGRRVVTELVTEKVGAIDAYVAAFAAEQGKCIAKIRVRGVEIDPGVKDASLPRMKGVLLLASNGVGFLPRGVDDEPDGLQFDDLIGIGDAALRGLRHSMNPIGNVARSELPAPLIARIEPGAVWLPHADYDAIHWGPDFGEITRGGERLLVLAPTGDTMRSVQQWAEAYDIPMGLVAPSPLLR